MTSVIENPNSFLSLFRWSSAGIVGSGVDDDDDDDGDDDNEVDEDGDFDDGWFNSNDTSWLVVDDDLTVGPVFCCICSDDGGWRLTFSNVAVSISTLLRSEKFESVPVLSNWVGDGGIRVVGNDSFRGDTWGFDEISSFCSYAARRARENSVYNLWARVEP